MRTVEAALWLAYLAGAKEAVKDYDVLAELDEDDQKRLHAKFKKWLTEMTE